MTLEELLPIVANDNLYKLDADCWVPLYSTDPDKNVPLHIVVQIGTIRDRLLVRLSWHTSYFIIMDAYSLFMALLSMSNGLPTPEVDMNVLYSLDSLPVCAKFSTIFYDIEFDAIRLGKPMSDPTVGFIDEVVPSILEKLKEYI